MEDVIDKVELEHWDSQGGICDGLGRARIV